MTRDARLTLARPDLAAASLEGVVAADRYEATRPLQVTAPRAALQRAPDRDGEWIDELVHGERFDALAAEGDYLWGQARRDGYVGFVRAESFGPVGAAPTHRIRSISSYAFAEPSFKSRPIGPFALNALVAVEAEEGQFSRAADGAFFWAGHLEPIGSGFETDWAAVAERFVGAPYLWSGRTSAGLDCSGLVQQALYACGKACPRDADQQAALGRGVGREELERGDLACWDGHIGIMLDAARLLHASSHWMATEIEPLADVIARNEAAGRGDPTGFRRL
ncbi:MAG TPA: NlpC/P60 family protein [Caulobacteraceae bacterium]|jgi:cell wall-associated NlpC family hydrolase|nr:NlpC/P60 family protein [Caulobacteraceae bacterium]